MRHALAPFAALLLASCATTPAPSPQDRFWSALQSHCGKAYDGKLVSTDARDASFPQARLVAHWAECDTDRTVIAFHTMDAGAADEPVWDRSRTWILTRERIENAATSTTVQITLKHDHRHADGEADAVTFYGGTTATRGTAQGQDFPVDPFSIALFEREGLAASVTNVWRMEVDPAGTPDATFAYQLTRRNDPSRLFRVEFDLTDPVSPPPPAWGWE